jgi:hypothetical protein
MTWWNPCDWGNTEDEDEKSYNDGAETVQIGLRRLLL